VKNQDTKEPLSPFNKNSPEMESIRKDLLHNGLYVYTHWHTILVIPPLIITENQLKEGFDALDKVLETSDNLVS
jgi:taurine---2-oxoglutarate transaminase